MTTRRVTPARTTKSRRRQIDHATPKARRVSTPRTRSGTATRQGDVRMAALDLWELAPPVGVWNQLAWIEIRGTPDYLDLPGTETTLPDGRRCVTYPPPDSAARRTEIQRVYGEVFEQSGLAQKKNLLRSYTANFPHLAFDSDGWLWPLWQEWRARYDKEDQRLLAALASGIRRRGAAWMSKAREHAWRVAMAKRCLSSLKEDPKLSLKLLYDDYREGASSSHHDLRRESETKYLRPLIQRIVERTGHETSASELKREKLSGVLRLAVGKVFRVRPRDLH
jgi:hypothetical protein